MNPDRPILVCAGQLLDADTLSPSPAAILLERQGDLYHILAIGPPPSVRAHPRATDAVVVERPDAVVFPALVNAHTHLDLTHIGPTVPSPGGGFQEFIALIRSRRHTDPDSVRASVRAGIEASLRGGVVAVGDIAGAIGGQHASIPFEEFCASPLWGTSYLEFFAIGSAATDRLKAVHAAVRQLTRVSHRRIRLGLQPHASYSVSLDGYRFALDLAYRLGMPLMTHLAESPEERQFIERASGPFRDLLESIGLWMGAPEGTGQGRSPLAQVAHLPGSQVITLVHLNDLSDKDLDLLTPAHRVVYCPRSSGYFRAPDRCGPHRYQELLSRGITVALGTDSLVNLSDQMGRLPRISTWDDMCLLHRRDGIDPRRLLHMATISGGAVLGLPAPMFHLAPGGYIINLAAVRCRGASPSLSTALAEQGDPELLCPVAW